MRLLHGLGDYPSLWPAALLLAAVPLVWAARCSPASVRLFVRRRVRLLAAVGMISIAAFVATGLTYLHCAGFCDLFEAREASVATLLRRGEVVYPNLDTQERYCAPYAPAFYLVLAAGQAVFGSTTWATKLPSVCAAMLALLLFWWIIRRQYFSRSAAWALTGLAAGLLMAFRWLPFWCKADPLVLCATTAGLFTAFRRGTGWCVLTGVCAGVAVGMKPHALAYFAPVLVVAWQTGWRGREYVLWGLVTTGVAAFPFLAMPARFPLGNYLAYLALTAREGCGLREVAGFCRWIGLLAAMVFVFDRLTLHPRTLTPGELRLRFAYRASLALAVALVAVPACSVGAGQPHLIPLIPLFLLAAGDRYSDRLRVRWRPAPHPFWTSAAVSTVLACVVVAAQSTMQMARFHASVDPVARACRVDTHRLLAHYARHTVLNGPGAGGDITAIYQRHDSVMAGNPVGIDAAAIIDYQRGGASEPDSGRLIDELRARTHLPVVWLFPRGSEPFTWWSIYPGGGEVFSPGFRRAFLAHHFLHHQTAFHDVYLPLDASGMDTAEPD